MSATHEGTGVARIESLPWVTFVTETDRDDAQASSRSEDAGNGDFAQRVTDARYRVDSDLAILRLDHEIHDVENLGYTAVAMSGVPEHGTRLFVR